MSAPPGAGCDARRWRPAARAAAPSAASADASREESFASWRPPRRRSVAIPISYHILQNTIGRLLPAGVASAGRRNDLGPAPGPNWQSAAANTRRSRCGTTQNGGRDPRSRWPPARPRPIRPIRRGRSGSWSARMPAAARTSSRACSPRSSQESLKQPFVVENRPGASNTIAADVTAKAPPDGHTLLVATNTGQAIAPHLHQARLRSAEAASARRPRRRRAQRARRRRQACR